MSILRLKLKKGLLCCLVLVSVAPATSFPAHDAAGLAQKIKDIAADGKNTADIINKMKEQLEGAQAAFEGNLKQDMDQAVASSAIVGQSAESLSRLEFLKETAALDKEGCDAVAASTANSGSMCNSVNQNKVRSAKRDSVVASKYDVLIGRESDSIEGKIKAFNALKLKQQRTLLADLERDIGRVYEKDFSEGLKARPATALVNTSGFLLGDDGFDAKYSEEAYRVVDLIAPSYEGEFISSNQKQSHLELINELGKDASRAAVRGTLQDLVSIRDKGDSGISSIDAYNLSALNMHAKDKEGFMFLVNNAPSIDMLPRLSLILMGKDADTQLKKFKSALEREKLLAIRLSSVVNS